MALRLIPAEVACIWLASIQDVVRETQTAMAIPGIPHPVWLSLMRANAAAAGLLGGMTSLFVADTRIEPIPAETVGE